MMPTIKWDLEGDSSDLRAALEQARGAIKDLQSQVDKLNDKKKKATKETKQFDAALSSLGKTAKGLGFGDTIEKVGNLSEGLSGVAGAAGTAGVALGVVALAAVEIGAVAGGIYLGVDALFDLTRAAYKANTEVEKLAGFPGFEPLAPGALEDLELANGSLDALAKVTALLTERMGAELAPVTLDVATYMLQLGLAAADAAKQMRGFGLIAEQFVVEFAKKGPLELQLLASAFGAVGEATEGYKDEAVDLVAVMTNLHRISDAEADARKRAAKSTKEHATADRGAADAKREAAAAAREQATAEREAERATEQRLDGVEKLDELTRHYNAEAIGGAQALDSWLVDQAMQISELVELTGDQARGEAALAAATEDYYDKLGELRAKDGAALDAETAKRKETREKDLKDAARATADTLGAAGDAFVDLAESRADAEMAATGRVSDETKKLQKAAFAAQKATAIAQAVINTALAITASLTVPFAGPVLAGIAAATGAAQIATIAATPAPKFAMGGMVPESAPRTLQGSGRSVQAEPGEAVLTRRGVQQAGGPNGVQGLNHGTGGQSGPLVIVSQYKHRVFNAFIQDNIRSPGPLREFVRGSSPVGQTGLRTSAG